MVLEKAADGRGLARIRFELICVYSRASAAFSSDACAKRVGCVMILKRWEASFLVLIF